MTERAPAEHFAYAVATAGERRAAVTAMLALLAFAGALVPVAHMHLAPAPALAAAVGGASLVAMLASAAILRNQFATAGYAPFALLGLAYAATAGLLVVTIAVAQPLIGVPPLDLGKQTVPWLWVARHAVFVVLIGAFVATESALARGIPAASAIRATRTCIAVTACALALVVTWLLVLHARLPALVAGNGPTVLYTTAVRDLLLGAAAIVGAMIAMRTALRRATHVWLAVVLTAFALDVYVGGPSAPHGSVLWYASLAFGLVWQCLFLVAQLRHANQALVAFAADQRSLVEETLRDPLTGLYNRRGFDERLAHASSQSRSARASLALIALDLDHFKTYNDHFGHVAGDEALRAIGAAIADVAARSTDSCARIGGEEFAVILAMTDDAGAIAVAERLRAAVLKLAIPHAPQARFPTMTVSIGVAVDDGSAGYHTIALRERADRALYTAKRNGRNRFATEDSVRLGRRGSGAA